MAQWVKQICLQCRRSGFNPWVGKISWKKKYQPIPVFLPEKSPEKGAWWAIVQGVTKSQT